MTRSRTSEPRFCMSYFLFPTVNHLPLPHRSPACMAPSLPLLFALPNIVRTTHVHLAPASSGTHHEMAAGAHNHAGSANAGSLAILAGASADHRDLVVRRDDVDRLLRAWALPRAIAIVQVSRVVTTRRVARPAWRVQRGRDVARREQKDARRGFEDVTHRRLPRLCVSVMPRRHDLLLQRRNAARLERGCRSADLDDYAARVCNRPAHA